MTLAAQRRWIMPKKARDAPDGIPALVAQVLACRGLAVGEMAAFLTARPTEEGPPMLDLDRAVERLRRALAARERIVVYGDYDVDGIAGSAILVRAFRQLGFVVGAYIPNRYEEGYGLNATALRQLAADGAKVIVSVDCGITAVKEAALARELGVDLIVTDHHHPPAVLPDAYALVNPRRPGDPSIDKELAGAGVALVLAKRLLGDLAYSLRQDELLQLCALATVADVVPLRGVNRVLTRLGLEALGELLGLFGILGEEEPQRVFGVVDATGRVEPWTEHEADLTRADPPELETGPLDERPHADDRRAIQRFEPKAREHAVPPAKRHDIGDRRERAELQKLVLAQAEREIS